MDENIKNHYRMLLEKYGDAPESAQWTDQQSQEIRFKELIKVGQIDGARVMDFGCGTAHLATYLKKHDICVQYTGVDVVEEFFQIAQQKHPEHRFGLMEDFINERFDYVFISGVFNNKQRGNRKFYQDSVRKLFAQCDVALAFNMMSTYVDYQDDDLFYEAPERAFSFVKQEITPFVTLRHNYEVKPGVIPFEFVIYAYREPQA